ncbi:hypothetical protein EXW27_29440 (plasmid) [Bacillus mycoides]|uniref:Uncharacterized protein n=1 Tax=Bacillus cereus VD048 TaxID=1053226 RepID=J8E6N2_BACCE|nr:hypothetical protein IIG_05166 [Bacillus cereus VD048]QWG81597.1 hypothetical protein EXW27_29440 [Bacillus mycoides]TXR81490.1 hypothetical protein DN408_13070 [Bacillus sp. AR13-1]
MNLLKQMLKSYTFLSLAIGLLLCYFRISGLDPQGLVFFVFGLDHILNNLIYAEPFRDMVFNNHIYAFRILTALIYGIFFDCLRYLIQRYLTPKYAVFFKYLKFSVLILVLISILVLVLIGILVNLSLPIIDVGL